MNSQLQDPSSDWQISMIFNIIRYNVYKFRNDLLNNYELQPIAIYTNYATGMSF